LFSTARLMRFSPAMSTTEYIIITSRVPTYGCTCPLASVLTINFGTPTGSARIAAVPMVVPADPPRLSTPDNLPCLCSSTATFATPAAASSTALPRSPVAFTCSWFAPAAEYIAARETSGSNAGGPITPASATSTGTPAAVSRSRT
jgi:hypothetical protein